MKTKFKLFSILMSLVMLSSSSMPIFAAEVPVNSEVTQIAIEQSAVAMPVSTQEIVPMSKGDEITFPLGSVGYISDAGLYPTFEMWVTGGDASTQVKFDVVSAGGTKYGPFGPLPADGSQGWYLTHTAIVGSGAWKFSAYVSSGPNNGNLICHVKQSN